MIKKYCINCHTLYDTGEETCPNCGFKVTDVKFVMQDGEVLTVNEYAMRKDATNLSMFDLLNKEIEEMAKIANGILLEVKPIKLRQKITKDVFEMLEQSRKETAREILQELYNEFSSGISCAGASEFLREYAKEKYGVEVE